MYPHRQAGGSGTPGLGEESSKPPTSALVRFRPARSTLANSYRVARRRSPASHPKLYHVVRARTTPLSVLAPKTKPGQARMPCPQRNKLDQEEIHVAKADRFEPPLHLHPSILGHTFVITEHPLPTPPHPNWSSANSIPPSRDRPRRETAREHLTRRRAREASTRRPCPGPSELGTGRSRRWTRGSPDRARLPARW